VVPAGDLRLLIQLLLAVAVVYAAVLTLVYFYQPKMLYLPNVAGRGHIASPADIGLEFEEVWLTGADGVRIHGWWVPAVGNGRNLIFFHGNAGNISHRLDSLRIFHELGLNVLMVDYRGYGMSDGIPSEQGTRLDALAAWEHLLTVRGAAPQTVVLFGRSLGGAVAAQLAGQSNPGGLILESTFTSVPDLGAELYPWLPVRLLSAIHYDTQAVIDQFDFPVLVIHGPQDDIIPYHHGQALFEKAAEPRQFLEINGGHNGGYLLDREAYLAGWRRFLATL
jgi:pimeloyl-ACP methyl ester carboxylesterase